MAFSLRETQCERLRSASIVLGTLTQGESLGGELADEVQQIPGNLAREVSESLSTHLPGRRFTVQVVEGVATIGGTMRSQELFDKIEALAMDVKGINSVTITAEIGPG